MKTLSQALGIIIIVGIRIILAVFGATQLTRPVAGNSVMFLTAVSSCNNFFLDFAFLITCDE